MSNDYSYLGSIQRGDINILAGADTSAYGTGNIYIASRAIIKGTDQSTASNEGALVVDGGIGLAKNLNVGGAAAITGAGSFGGTFTVAGAVTFTDATASTLSTNGSVVLSGGMGIAGSINVGTNASVVGTLSVDGDVTLNSTTASTSSTTGALVVDGGLGVAGSGYFGGTIGLQSATFTSSGNDVNINANTAGITLRNTAGSTVGEFASSTTNFIFRTSDVTPAVIMDITKATGVVRIETLTDSTGAGTGAFQVAGGASIEKDLFIGGDLDVTGNFVSNTVTFSGTQDSTSPGTGAIVTSGGIGVAKTMTVGEDVVVAYNNFSDAPTVGLFRVNGATFTDNATAASGTVTAWYGSRFMTPTFAATNASVTVTDAATIYIQGPPSAGTNATLTNVYALRIASGILSTADATNATSTSTGSIVSAGGLGLAKAAYIGGVLRVTDTTVSTSATTGAATIAGGLGVALDTNLGGDLTFHGGAVSVIGRGDTAQGIQILGGTTAGTDAWINLNGASNSSGSAAIGSPSTVDLQWYNGSSDISQLRVSSGGVSVFNTNFAAAPAATAGNLFTVKGGTFTDNATAASGTLTSWFGTYIAAPTLAATNATVTTTNAATFYIANSPTAGANETITNAYALWVDAGRTRLDGVVQVTDVTATSSTTSGALIVSGGVGVAGGLNVGGALSLGGVLTVSDTTQSTSTGTGSAIFGGGIGVAKNAYIGGLLRVTDTTGSTSTSTGSAVFSGGVGVAENLYVGGTLNVTGNTVLSGTLNVLGGITTIDSTTVTIADNVILANAKPGASADGGFGIKRYQAANNTGAGDVVSDTPVHSGTAQAGSTATTIVLQGTASAVNDFYNGSWIRITGGTGVNQVRRILDYDGTTKTATIYSTADQAAANPPPVPTEGLDWATTPDATSTYSIYNSQYILTYYDEGDDEYVFGSTQTNPTNAAFVSVNNRIKIHAGDVDIDRVLTVDTINEHTTNSGVTIEGVTVEDGALTGVTSINGVGQPVVQQVSLQDNTTARVNIPGTAAYGLYDVFVESTSATGARARFMIVARSGTAGSVSRLVSVKGSNNENLDIEWVSGQIPQLRHLQPIAGASGAMLTYNVRVQGT